MEICAAQGAQQWMYRYSVTTCLVGIGPGSEPKRPFVVLLLVFPIRCPPERERRRQRRSWQVPGFLPALSSLRSRKSPLELGKRHPLSCCFCFPDTSQTSSHSSRSAAPFFFHKPSLTATWCRDRDRHHAVTAPTVDQQQHPSRELPMLPCQNRSTGRQGWSATPAHHLAIDSDREGGVSQSAIRLCCVLCPRLSPAGSGHPTACGEAERRTVAAPPATWGQTCCIMHVLLKRLVAAGSCFHALQLSVAHVTSKPRSRVKRLPQRGAVLTSRRTLDRPRERERGRDLDPGLCRIPVSSSL